MFLFLINFFLDLKKFIIFKLIIDLIIIFQNIYISINKGMQFYNPLYSSLIIAVKTSTIKLANITFSKELIMSKE